MWVILFNFLWLNIHCTHFAVSLIFLMIIARSYPTSLWLLVFPLVLVGTWAMASPLWPLGLFHLPRFSSSFLVDANEYSTKNWKKLLCIVWDNLCSSTIFHILLCKLQQPWHIRLSILYWKGLSWVFFKFFLLACGLETPGNHLGQW